MSKMKNIDFKYENLLKNLKNQIDSGLFLPDDKIPSEPEISEKYGLSRNTIRQAMKELEIAGYIYRIQGKGTFVASREHKPKKIAVVLYDLDYSVHPFTGRMIQGIGEVAAQREYSLEIIATGTKDNIEQEILSGATYAGFIIGSLDFPSAILGRMITENIPFVFAKNYIPGMKVNAVLVDYKKAGKLACEHLLSLGHKKIALLNAGKIPISADFTAGVKDAAANADICIREEDIFEMTPDIQKSPFFIDKLMKFTALIVFDDDIAVEIIRSLDTNGKKVPGDISVVGCNDMPSSRLFVPAITTSRIPIYELGKIACEQLVNIIDGTVMEDNIVLEPEFIIRESTSICNSTLEEKIS